MALSTKTATVIPSEYGVHATVIDGRGTRPEPTPEEREAARAADRITLTEYLRVTGWSGERLDYAIGAYGHPRPAGRRVTPDHATEPYYSRAAIQVWRARIVTDLREFGFAIKP
jgi:hypothetical protein